MTGTSKRRMLKWLGATPLVALPFASLAGIADLAMSQSEKSPSTASGSDNLDIRIVDTSSVAGNTVLLHNSGREKIVISQFVVGTVIFNSRMLDLNALVSNGPILIQPGQRKSFATDIWNVLVVPAIEHTYADHAVEILSAETRSVRLGAYLFDDKAVVYPDLAKTIYG